MASYHTMMHEIHVLLVDHDTEGLISIARQLELCHYKVTLVDLASAATSMLSSGKVKFDVVIANVHSPDAHVFKLLQHAANMGIPIILMSVDDNAFLAMRAIENGAFLYIKKPPSMEILRCLWQHVLREKTRMIRESDMVAAGTSHGARGIEFREVVRCKEENPSDIGGMMMAKNNKGKSKKKYRGKGIVINDEGCHLEDHNNTKRKMCTEWTLELHAKFMDAVEKLGEGRCFPKEILELMNVPGLTRMQVASHLQKCRNNNNWQSPEEQNSRHAAEPTSFDANGSQHKPRRFGSKPLLGKARSNQAQMSHGTEQRPNTRLITEITNINEGHGNMGSVPAMTSASHHQQYGSLEPGPSNAALGASSSSNPRHHSNHFFSFPDVDCLIHNVSHGSGMNNSSSAGLSEPHNFHAGYNEENSAGPSMDTRSHWSLETSNFESDQSESSGQEE